MSIKNLINHIETLDYQSRLLTNDNTTYAIWNDYMDLHKDIIILKDEKGGEYRSFIFCSETFTISNNAIAAHFLVNALNRKTNYGRWTVNNYKGKEYISYELNIQQDLEFTLITSICKEFSRNYSLFSRAFSRFEKEKGVDGPTLSLCIYLSENKNLNIHQDEKNYLLELQSLIEQEKIEEYELKEKDREMLNKLYEQQLIEIDAKIQFLKYKYFYHIKNTVINLNKLIELKST